MKKAIVVLALFCGLGMASAAEAAPKHGAFSRGIGKAAKFVGSTPAHPITRLKQLAGTILTVTEPVLDGGVYVGEALDKFGSLELKHNPFHYVYLGVDKVHDLDEKAQDLLFGKHN